MIICLPKNGVKILPNFIHKYTKILFQYKLKCMLHYISTLQWKFEVMHQEFSSKANLFWPSNGDSSIGEVNHVFGILEMHKAVYIFIPLPNSMLNGQCKPIV